MSDKLIIKHENLPLKAYSKEDLKKHLEGDFLDWLCDLLGLTGEESAKRLLIALPAIEKHFWSLGFKEIQKAFTMYADSELITKPIPNYFTRILVGQIFKEYRQQKPVKKKEIEKIEISEEDKKLNEILSATICFDYYIDNGFLNETSAYLYSVLLEKGLFKYTEKEKEAMIVICKELDAPIEDQRLHYKKMCIRRYFDRLHAKGKHLKEFI